MLSFRLGRVPVRIHPLFFIVAAILGASGGSLLLILSWIGIVFVSVMLHELGHAGMGMAFGLDPVIDLHGMGGTTSWTTRKRLSPAQRIAISLAGPFAGLAAGGVVYALASLGVVPASAVWAELVHQWLWVNVGWGIFNLLPILPLDGGNVLYQALDARTPGSGERPARIASIVVAIAIALVAWKMQAGLYVVVLVASFAALNYRGLQAIDARQA
jgi:Zn-dependent protease